MHDQASGWSPPAAFVRHQLNAEGLMGDMPFWGPFWQARALTAEQQQHFSALRQELYAILAALPTDASG